MILVSVGAMPGRPRRIWLGRRRGGAAGVACLSPRHLL